MSEGAKINITADFSGQMRKSAVVRNLPRAFFKNAESWASETVLFIKKSYKGGSVFRRPPKEFDLRLGMKVNKTGADSAEILVGTGDYVGKPPVIYARIHEEGGTIRPTKARALAIPFPGVTGSPRQYPEAFILPKMKGFTIGIIALAKEGKRSTKIIPLFLLRKQVTLPARRWFSTPIAARRPELDRAISTDGVWARAAAMADNAAAKEASSEGGK
jgi:hypothetical protein